MNAYDAASQQLARRQGLARIGVLLAVYLRRTSREDPDPAGDADRFSRPWARWLARWGALRDGWLMEWWIWIVVGFGCLTFELATPGSFVFLFFGLAGLVVAALAGWAHLDLVWQQSVAFVATATLGLLLLRRRCSALLRPRGPKAQVSSMLGEVALTLEPIAAGAVGKVECHGTNWSGHNLGSQAMGLGQRCRIDHIEGLTLMLRAEETPPKEAL